MPRLDLPLAGPAPRLYFVLGTLLALACVAALAIGPLPLAPPRALACLAGACDETLVLVVREIRLPRVLLAVLVGASLGIAGAALQGLLRNPLAEPGLVGVAGSAALAAVLCFYSGLSALAFWILPASGMLGALAAVVLIETLAGRRGDTLALILAGVAINSLAGALTTLVLSLSSNPFATYEIFTWLLGSLANRSFEHLWLALPFAGVGIVLLWRCAPALDALSLGEDTAASLGVDLAGTRRRIVLGTALGVGAAVAVSGVVGFVGLVVPHLLRRHVGHRPGALLGASALGGALLTVLADLGTRLPLHHGELKLGVVTALVGAPFFLHLVLRSRRQ